MPPRPVHTTADRIAQCVWLGLVAPLIEGNRDTPPDAELNVAAEPRG
jgi:hypothetical protein